MTQATDPQTTPAQQDDAVMHPPLVSLIVTAPERAAAEDFANFLGHVLVNSFVQGRGPSSPTEFIVEGYVDDSVTGFLDHQKQLERRNNELEMELRQIKAEKDHLMTQLVVAESVNAMLQAFAAELEAKKLAALLLAGELRAYDYEERRARSLIEHRERITAMRRRATDGASNAKA